MQPKSAAIKRRAHELATEQESEATIMNTQGNVTTTAGMGTSKRRKASGVQSPSHHQQFIPHGIVKLPQSVASALASDFLAKREIRDLGVTCRWMLLSLRDCSINQSIPLRLAVERLKRQDLALNSPELAQLSNLLIGKFRDVFFYLSEFTSTERELVLELPRLVDTHKLTYRGVRGKLSNTKAQAIYPSPLVIPLNLKELIIQGKWFLPPLAEFILPETLTSITCFPNDNVQPDLVKVKWPTKLKTLLNLNTCEPLEGLVLPSGLHTLSFADNWRGPPIPLLQLPITITDLTIHRFEDVKGRYRDLVFPSQLQRLVISCEIEKNDFNLLEWRGLPPSCINFEFRLIPVQTDRGLPTVPRYPSTSSTITISPFIQHARIYRQQQALNPILASIALVKLDLTSATSLITLMTDSLSKIEWPATATTITTTSPESRNIDLDLDLDICAPVAPPLPASSCGLSHLKLVDVTCGGHELIQQFRLVPGTIVELDLTGDSRWVEIASDRTIVWSDLLKSTVARRIHLELWTHFDRFSLLVSLFHQWSGALSPSYVIEGYLHRTDSDRTQFVRLRNGVFEKNEWINSRAQAQAQIQTQIHRHRIYDPTPTPFD